MHIHIITKFYFIIFYFFSYKEGNQLRLKEKIKAEQEDVVEDEGEHEQTTCDQEKVKKEPKSVLGVVKKCKKSKNRTMGPWIIWHGLHEIHWKSARFYQMHEIQWI